MLKIHTVVRGGPLANPKIYLRVSLEKAGAQINYKRI